MLSLKGLGDSSSFDNKIVLKVCVKIFAKK